MEELLIKFQTKAHNCSTKTKEGRARKGAYVDCVIMLQEFIETYSPPLPQSIQEALNSGDGVYRP
jgi:hypothetical protein